VGAVAGWLMRTETRAASRFEVTAWQEDVWLEQGGVKLSRTRVTKRFFGDLEGESVAELVMAYAPGEVAAYSGLEHVTGRLNGRGGSFVIRHDAQSSAEGAVGTWAALQNSGTGELAGLMGTATFGRDEDGGHAFTLDYTLDYEVRDNA
jgi:hypothetical protein